MTASDLEPFFEHQRDSEALRMAAFSPRDREAFLAHWARILEDPATVKRTVLADGEIAGYVVCFGEPGERLVGYWIGREHWGRGVATAALRQFLQAVPERPLLARVARHNMGSIRVLEKCGFEQAGAAESAAGGELPPVEELTFRLAGDGS